MTSQVGNGRRRRRQRNSELQRRQNMAAFWQQRYDKAANDPRELADVAFDRARAAAARAEEAGQAQVMYELAKMLSEWAERLEQAETKRLAGRHGS